MNHAAEINRRRTFAIISHPDAGKTTVTEKLLFYGQAIKVAGEVKARKASTYATSDWMKIEKERGISVTTAAMQFPYQGLIINLLDTPGHVDFSEDTYRTLTAVDAALMVIDGSKGVESRTIKLMEICRKRHIPIWIFINKIDRDIRDPMDLLDEIEEVLHIDCAPINWPVGMGRHLSGLFYLHQDRFDRFIKKHSKEPVHKSIQGLHSLQLQELLGSGWQEFSNNIELVKGAGHQFDKETFLEGNLAPVYFGTALGNFGIREMFTDFVRYAPAPGTKQTATRNIRPQEKNFSGFIFKIQANMDLRHRDRIAFMRICSGLYKPGMKMFHVQSQKSIKVSNAITFMAADKNITDNAYAGDIIGMHDRGSIRIGDTFTQGEDLNFSGIPTFVPELFRLIRLQDPWKSKQLEKGLRELTEEGTMQLFKPLKNNDKILGAVGQLQFDVVIYRLIEEYKVICDYVPYNLFTIRWVTSSDQAKLDHFVRQNENNIAVDATDSIVYMASSRVNLQMKIDAWPDIEFQDLHEIS